MMVTLLLYAYCIGERSSRRIERRCQEDIAFRVITANAAPDHSTIARFRQANEQALTACFTQVLRLCAAAGLVRVGMVALDGTTIEANASLHANRSREAIEREVQRMLSEAAAADRGEDEGQPRRRAARGSRQPGRTPGAAEGVRSPLGGGRRPSPLRSRTRPQSGHRGGNGQATCRAPTQAQDPH